MGSPKKKQQIQIANIIIQVDNPTPEFERELEMAYNNQNVMYFDRFLYGVPEMIMPLPDNSGYSICVLPMPDLLDPWAITQDLKDELEEADNNGEFSDDPLE